MSGERKSAPTHMKCPAAPFEAQYFITPTLSFMQSCEKEVPGRCMLSC